MMSATKHVSRLSELLQPQNNSLGFETTTPGHNPKYTFVRPSPSTLLALS